jgi:hypothetical protein
VNNDNGSETVIARHETIAIMTVHLPRIQNLVVGDAPPSPMRVCRLGGPGAVSYPGRDRVPGRASVRYPRDMFIFSFREHRDRL